MKRKGVMYVCAKDSVCVCVYGVSIVVKKLGGCVLAKVMYKCVCLYGVLKNILVRRKVKGTCEKNINVCLEMDSLRIFQ